MNYLGDYAEDYATLNLKFLTKTAADVPTTLAGTPVVSVYKANDLTQSVAGVTLTVDFDSLTGLNNVLVDLSADAFYAIGNDYQIIITTGTVGGVSAVGVVVGTFSIENRFDEVDVTKISGDATAADNLEAQYDTTGLTGESFPSSQAQVASIGTISGGGQPFEIIADNTGGAIKGVTFVGAQTGTFANTEAEDGSYHVIDDTGNAIDIVYQTNVGGSRIGSRINFEGFLNSNNDELNIQAYDFVGADWETVLVLNGQNGSSNVPLSIPILLKHTGIGADLGDVLIRFVGVAQSNPQLNVDLLHIEAVGATSAIGFEGGAVWLDTVGGTSGVGEGVGFYTRPSDNITDALTIASSNNLRVIHSLSGSSFILPSSVAGLSFKGFSYTVTLNGKSVSGSLFEGATIVGNDSGTNAIHTVYDNCIMGDNTLGVHDLHNRCGLSGDIILAEAGTYTWVDPVSHIAGSGSPSVDFRAAAETKNLNVRGIFGGLEVKNYNAGGGTHDMTIGGNGQLIVDASGASGSIELRGNFKETDNSGGAVAIVRDLNTQNTVEILEDTGTTGVLLNASATSAQLVGDIWDEPLTGATHNIPTSAGRRVREITGTVIRSGTAQGPGANGNQIVLDTGASALDGAYDPALITIVLGTGIGQSRLILEYDGTTKIAAVDRTWKVNPDATSEFIITASAGREHVNEGLAQDGTSNTIKLNVLASSFDNAYIGQTVFVRSGLGEDQTRLIGAYDGTTKIATIDRDWDIIPDDTSGYSMLPTASHSTVEIAIAVWDRVISKANHNIAQSAGKLLRQGSRIVAVEGAVADPTTIATTTVFRTDLTEADDFWNDALLSFTSGPLTGQSKAILSYAQANGEITLDEALTAPPSDTDEFDIFASHIHPISQIADGVLTTAMTEAYAADGVEPTLAEALYFVMQYLVERGVVGTTGTIRKLDGTTPAATFTLDDTTNPTDSTRAT